MSDHIVATIEEIPVGGRKTVQIEGRSITIFNVKGTFYALRNICPHQGAPLGQGSIGGIHVCGDTPDEIELVKMGEIVRCPWHGWEFDITSGQSVFDPNGCYVKTYDITIGTIQSEPVQAQTYPTSVRANDVIIHL